MQFDSRQAAACVSAALHLLLPLSNGAYVHALHAIAPAERGLITSCLCLCLQSLLERIRRVYAARIRMLSEFNQVYSHLERKLHTLLNTAAIVIAPSKQPFSERHVAPT